MGLWRQVVEKRTEPLSLICSHRCYGELWWTSQEACKTWHKTGPLKYYLTLNRTVAQKGWGPLS